MNEDAIKIIEEKVRAGVRENPNLLNGTAYEQTTQNFHFLLGHRLLILDFANKAREFVQSKKKKHQKKLENEIVTEPSTEQSDILEVILMKS